MAEEGDKSNGVISSMDSYTDDEDDYKAEGVINLVIRHFSKLKTQILSEPVYVRGLPWKIMAMQRETNRCRALGFFLQCNADSDSPSWSCSASAVLKVKAQQEGVEDYSRQIAHIFYPKENDWGYTSFLSMEALLDPDRGFIKDDTIILEVHVNADAPHGVQWDSKKHTGHIGLKNQGATCYMNSLLQTLFFTNKLRKVVYQISTENDDPHKSVALAMQRVFYELQFSDKPVGTKKLTRSFGWDTFDSFLQHDVQELCRVLLDNLESKMKGSCVSGGIPQLFEGKMKSFIRCLNVPFESNREEAFYDVQLNVKGKKNILDSFREYIAEETLEGDNKYDAGHYGLQDAVKGVKFLKFPPVLHLQLMRVQYDPLNDQNLKINDRFEFPEKLDLDEFLESREETPAKYTLHAVLVHSGDFHGGHYVVYISPKGNGKWCKFDDDVVCRCTKAEAIEMNYGGADGESIHRQCTNAYMLSYIRDSCMGEILAPVTEADIPVQLRNRLQAERDLEAQRKREKSEAHLFCLLSIVTSDAFEGHQGPELIELDHLEQVSRKFRVKRSMEFRDLYPFLEKQYNLIAGKQFRLWPFTTMNTLRPSNLSNIEACTMEHLSNNGDTEVLVFMELFDFVHEQTELPPYRPDEHVLVFLKYFDPRLQVTVYAGHIIMPLNASIADIAPELRARAKLPANSELIVWEEDKTGNLSEIQKVGLPLRHQCGDFCDGLLLVYQSEQMRQAFCKKSKISTAPAYYCELNSRIELELTDKVASETVPPIVLFASLEWTYADLAMRTGKEINYDPFKIQFSRASMYKDGSGSPVKFSYSLTLKDIINSVPRPRGHRYRFLYQRMPHRIDELELRQQVRVQFMDAKLHVEELIVYVERCGLMKSIIEEVKSQVNLPAEGSGQFRIVLISSHRLTSILPLDHMLEQVPYNSALRVEEVPLDQVIVDSKTEYLLPVTHFHKDTYHTFGVPFYIKIRNEEPFSSVKQRIQKLLDVPDKEYEKYKFALCTLSRTHYFDNENFVINLTEFNMTAHFSASSKPWLGLDHVNKAAKGRGLHSLEKAIVIHN
ncbi:hypothetical protein M513_08320 [Trichuris suis]|uniref:Ubiquitin carboxyl-terminal hydrolase 7 n=2 Tax=Trichuris suis TaxID=68888 RepID=A0A085M0N3_9BILA|nr:hypothetical protein M513_08320 [Trichuris suis]